MDREAFRKECELNLNTLPLSDRTVSCNSGIFHLTLRKRAISRFLPNLALNTRQVGVSHLDHGGKKDNKSESRVHFVLSFSSLGSCSVPGQNMLDTNISQSSF